MNTKRFITAQELLIDSFKLADLVYKSGFRPHFIVGIWRGGAPVGIAVQEYFDYRHIKTDHIAVRTSSYLGITQQAAEIKVHGLHYLIDSVCANDEILIVDDVFDSGRSVDALVAQILQTSPVKSRQAIRVACPWYKPTNTKVNFKPDYYVQTSDDWLVFPHELAGLSVDEIIQGKSELAAIHDVLL